MNLLLILTSSITSLGDSLSYRGSVGDKRSLDDRRSNQNGTMSRSAKRDDTGHQSRKRVHSREDQREPDRKHGLVSQRRHGSSHKDDVHRKRLLLDETRNLTKSDSNHSKDTHKKLSFFAGNDNESDNDEEADINQIPDESRKKTNQVVQQSNNNNGADCKSRAVDRVVHIADHKVATAVESDHEDASSTSSCSCEDHSSVGDGSDNPHGDLDYDEDSISGSPQLGSMDSKQDNQLVKSPALGNNAVVSASPTAVNGAEDETTSDSREDSNNQDVVEATKSLQEETIMQDGEIESSKDESEAEEQVTRPTRIRSFINFDHNTSNPKIERALKGANKKDGLPKRQKKDKSNKSYEHLLKYFLKDACYFQIKSINHENVDISKSMGIWSTPIQNEIKLNAAFRDHRNVILIFSVQQSGAFQGFAKMTSESQPNDRRMPWVLPERFNVKSLGGLFQVEWLCTKELAFTDTRDLCNPYNNNKPIKVARDGQQVEPSVGKKLCTLFPLDSRRRLLQAVENLKRQNRLRKQAMHHRKRLDDTYPPDYPRSTHHSQYPRANLGSYIPPPHYDAEELNAANHFGRLYDDFYPPGSIDMRRRDHQPLPNPELMMREMHHHRLGLYPSHPQAHPYATPGEFDNVTMIMRSSGMNYYHNQPPLPRNQVGDAFQSDHFTFNTYPTIAARPLYETWMVSSEMNRYHPYHRTRR